MSKKQSRRGKKSKSVGALLLLSLLSACGGEPAEEAQLSTAPLERGSVQEDLQAACARFPTLPGCGGTRVPEPGFAKFTLGRAEAVRWLGVDACQQIDLKTGRQSGNGLIKVEGEVKSDCDPSPIHFAFVYRQHSTDLVADAWTSAFLPLNAGAAERLLDSCSGLPRPPAAAVLGSWWKSNNRYAENLMLEFFSPLAYATKLLPFDDDGFERLEDDRIAAQPVASFRNAHSTVWMSLQERNRPLRVISNRGDRDIAFTEWGQDFSAEIPADLRNLSELCAL